MARKKVTVDHGSCIGCGSCVASYPDDFTFDDDGLAVALVGEAEEEAADACPVGAIQVED